MRDGFELGSNDGNLDGMLNTSLDGLRDRNELGLVDGVWLCSNDGFVDGFKEGHKEGFAVGLLAGCIFVFL